MRKFPKWIPVAFLVLAGLGLVDASYLTFEHLRGVAPTCNILHGCEVVTTSAYSEILGVPVALLGALYYLMMLVLAVLYLDRRKSETLVLMARLSPLGLVAAIYFTGIQAFVLNAWCQWCVGSAITSTLLFLLSWYFLAKYRPEPRQEDA